ncbi:MAG TPA: DUF4157 domain-containing protein [Actinomycetota bacterium]|nr:DUF4157 domain-containing protein [Actinomycetota bacterium]
MPDELAGAARRALETGDPEVVRAALGRGEPLDGGTRARMETAFGHDFARVRVHTDFAAARATAGLDARAVAVGTDVAFAPGEYRPGSPAGDALLAHELAHVVQQGGATGADAGSLDAGAAEHDADDAAAGAVASLWGRTTRAAERVRAAMPRLRSGLALRACRSRPTGTCHVTSGPSYSPSGTIPVTTTGTTKQAATFTMSATFANDPGAGRVPACCEVRQFIKWDTAFHTQAGGPPHSGFPSTAGPNVWHEDRDSADTRYGHRSGSHSAPSSGDEYRTGGARDQANGDTYHGSDAPSGFASDVGQYQFQLKVIDTCNGYAEKASSSIITINW